MSYATYGGHTHSDGELDLTQMSIRYNLSPRGRRKSKTITMNCKGELLGTGSTLLTSIDSLINAYAYDYNDWTLWYDSTTPTRHRLTNDSTCVSGVKVIYRSWDGGPEQLATVRTYNIVLQAEYTDADSQMLFWEETLRMRGNCGPRVEVVETIDGPVAQELLPATSQRIVQSGKALGYLGYVLPPGPIFPAIEHQDLRAISYGTPDFAGLAFTNYPSEWTYYMTSAVPQEAVPIPR